jgi:hypothetical protein
MRITAAGNVGIGTTTPDSALDLGAASQGRALTWESYSNVFSAYSSGNLVLAQNFYGDTATDTYKTSLTASYGAAGILISGTAAGLNGVMRFYVDNAAAKTAGAAFTPTERMQISGNGAIKFSTYGAGTFTGTVAYNLAVDASGNVIETAGGVVDGSGTANKISKWQDANTLTDANITDNGTTVRINSLPLMADSRLAIGTAGADQTYANVFIGGNLTEGSSQYALLLDPQLDGTTNYGILSNARIAASVTATTAYGIYQLNNELISGASVVNNFGIYIANQTSGTTQNWNLYSVTGKNYFGGNVLIGTTTDSGYKLRVNGTSYFDGLAHFGQTATTGSAFRWGSLGTAVSPDTMLCMNQLWNGSGWTILDSAVGTGFLNLGGAVASPNIEFGTGGANTAATTKMIILNNGNVGIGTASPASRLHVVGGDAFLGLDWTSANYDSNTPRQFRIASNGDNSGYITQAAYYSASTASTTFFRSYVNAASSGALVFESGAGNFNTNGGIPASYAERMRITSAGNVGIGTTAPGTILHLSSASPELSFTATALNRTSFVGMPDGANFYIKNTTAGNLYISDYNSVYIAYGANSQNVGIGTTGPTEKLHVDGSTLITYNNSFQSTNSVGNKAILARVSPTSGIINYAEYATATNLNGFVIGSDDARVKGNITGDSLEFITNTSTRMTILSSGNVGINTTTPGSTLHVVGDVLIQTGALGVGVNPNATDGRIDASNDIVAFSTSDKRLKENITPIANALEKVRSLTGVEFDWKEETKSVHGYEGHDVGVIAQDVQAVLPEAVRTNDTGYLSVRYEKLIGLLIEGMKEQQAQIDELKAQINDSSR